MNTKVLKTDNYVSPDYFHTKAKTYLINNTNQKKSTSIATLDIDHFNYINDMFGFENGDRMLQILIDHISKHIKKGDFFTRIHADVFAFCLQTKDHDEISAYFNTLTTWPKALKDLLPQHYSVTASGGIVVIDDYSMPISAYLDKANYARQNSKGTQTNSFRYFDEKMSASLQWEKVVTFSMESALENREFEMYLQPKFLIKTNEVVGAEALCRWNHPEHGLIAPDRFIPILEQNGFIRQLDFYMLEEACHFLNRNKKQGLPLIPISVNFSKTHLSSDDLVDRIFKTVNRLGINTKLIEIEFTESITIEGFERLVEVVTDLKILGFSVSLDDFGSAYSSLNCLQELPIDIIKIDKGFLNSSTNNEKGKLIISKVVELIKSLRMLSVMEGVETNEQVDFLHKLSCDLGQGYFYAKPMPADQFLNFLRNDTSISNIETYIADQNNEDKSYLHVIPYEFQMDNWELYTLGKNIDMGLMKGYLDGEATVQYVNDRALEYLGYTRQEFREVFHNSIAAFTHPDDVTIVQKNAEQLIKTGKPLQFKTRAFHKSGRIIILQGRSSCVIDDRGRPIGLYAFQDVTEEIEKTQQLQSSLKDKIKELELVIKRESNAREELHLINERYQAIVEQSNDIMFDWDFVSDTLVLSNHLKHRFLMNEKTENMSTSTILHKKIHPDDLSIFKEWVFQSTQKKGSFSIYFRHLDRSGGYAWIHCKSTTLCNEDGTPTRAVGLLSDITAQKEEHEELTFKSQRDSLTKLFNKGETQHKISDTIENHPNEKGAFFIVDIDNFKHLNDSLGHQFGDTILVEFSQKMQNFFSKNEIVGRIGGDEFVIFAPGLDMDGASELLDKLMACLRLEYYGENTKYDVYGSVGAAYYPIHGHNFEELYNNADIALYESKRSGKNKYTIFQEHLSENTNDKRTLISHEEGFLNSYYQNDFTFKIFEILYESKDLRASIQRVLELLGKRFKVDRVHIFQYDKERHLLCNTYEWCDKTISPMKKELENIPYDYVKKYLSAYTREGIYCCPDVRNADADLFTLCEPRNIKSLLHCAIYEDGKIRGLIGFDMCKDYRKWSGVEMAILGYLSRILSVFLNKSQTGKELQNSYQNYVKMINHMNSYVYVINADNYQLLYVNEAIKKLGLDCGYTCYKMAYGNDTPCEKCPIHSLVDGEQYASSRMYSEALKSDVLVSVSRIKWSNEQDAIVVNCTEMSNQKA